MELHYSERPLFADFNPFLATQNADPYEIMQRARHEQPVFFAPEFDFWVVTRYSDANRIFGEPTVYSNSSVLAPRMDRPARIEAEFGDRQLEMQHQLVMSDPPVHTRLKALMSPAFLPSRVKAREPWIRSLCHRLIDSFADDGQADLVAQFAAKIPPAVIGKVVGAPEDDAQAFAGWVDNVCTLSGAWDATEEERTVAWRGVFAFEDYIKALVAARRAEPQDDLTTDFIQALSEDGSPAMNDVEVMWNVFNVAGAGADTTGILIAQMIHLLLSHPEQWQALKDEPELMTNAINETLRLRSPVRGLMRKTVKDVTLDDVVIPAGSSVFVHIASANHDEAVFANPEQFDIRRANAKKNLGLGSRAHACIGAPLARLEARIAIETLIERLPYLELAQSSRALSYKVNLMLPAITRLDVRW